MSQKRSISEQTFLKGVQAPHFNVMFCNGRVCLIYHPSQFKLGVCG